MLLLKIYLIGVLVYFVLFCLIDIKTDDDLSVRDLLWNLVISLSSWFAPLLFISALFFLDTDDLE